MVRVEHFFSKNARQLPSKDIAEMNFIMLTKKTLKIFPADTSEFKNIWLKWSESDLQK